MKVGADKGTWKLTGGFEKNEGDKTESTLKRGRPKI